MDSLINLLKNVKEDTSKVKNLLILSKEYLNQSDIGNAFLYANQGKSISLNLGSQKYMAKSNNILGKIYRKKSDYKEALNYQLQALKYFESKNDYLNVANIFVEIGIIYDLQTKYSESLKFYFHAINEYEKINNNAGVARAYNNIGIIHDNMNDFDNALKFYFKSLEFFKRLNDEYSVAALYGNIAVIYDLKNEENEALKYYNMSINLKEKLLAFDDITAPLINIGELYIRLSKPIEARKYLTKSLILCKKTQNKKDLSLTYWGLALIDSLENKFNDAFAHYKLFHKYNDSIYNEENSRQINELSAQYQSEKKKKEIAQLNLDVVTKQKKVEQKNFIIYGTVTGAILVLVLIALLYNRNQLKQKNSYQTSIAKQQEENALAVLQAQENERTRIAKDLHDGVGAFLSTLKLNVQTLENALSAEKTAYNNTLDLIDKTSVELRNVMNNLSDETLQQQGLIAAITELTLRVNQIGVTQIRFQHHGFKKRIHNIIEINLYRAAQELVQNCLKHAVAKKATLQLIEHDASIVLMIEDNGVGFNPDDKLQNMQGGMGLNNIRKRIAFIKGSVQIESAPQKGTTWVIEVPKQFV